MLADGSIKTLPIFLCKVKLGDKLNDVSTVVMGNDVLVGMELISGYNVCINAVKGVVNVERASIYSNNVNSYSSPMYMYSRLTHSLRCLTNGGCIK